MHRPVAIITGAGSGIGRATAVALCRRGYRLLLVGRREHLLRETADLLATIRAGAAAVLPLDVTGEGAGERAVGAALAHFGQIDAVVNNAGVAPSLTVEQTTDDRWRAVVDTNLSAAFAMVRAAWPTFRRRGGGTVVNVSSVAARDPWPGFAAYSAAKAGLIALSLSLAREGAPLGIRAYTVAPGATETPLLRSVPTAAMLAPAQVMDPADVARAIADCVSGQATCDSGGVVWMEAGA